MNQIDAQIQYPETTDSGFSCDLLLTYLSKEIATEYVKRLESNQSIEVQNQPEENE